MNASVVGMHYTDAFRAGRRWRRQGLYRLVGESNNPYDANAVSVCDRGVHMGYLTRETAATIRPLLDAGTQIQARYLHSSGTGRTAYVKLRRCVHRVNVAVVMRDVRIYLSPIEGGRMSLASTWLSRALRVHLPGWYDEWRTRACEAVFRRLADHAVTRRLVEAQRRRDRRYEYYLSAWGEGDHP